MTNQVDAYNHIMIEKKEQVNELLSEKKHLNAWLDDYHHFTFSTTRLYHHLADRYYESDMFSRIEANSDRFQSGQRQVMNELYHQQSEIDKKIRLINEDIEDIEKHRHIEIQKEQEGNHTYEH
ncbi:hypothetical protein K4S66_12200 [Staphylococcus epidermidis]|nr:hypothetical protein [Staphylococcus epidermidis]